MEHACASGMGMRRLPVLRRHGARDAIPSGCSCSCAACACTLPRAWSVSLSSPILWQHGVVRHVERLPGQGARAGCAQDGHSRSRTRVAASCTRSGPPASTASEASRGPFCVCEVEEREREFFLPKKTTHSIRILPTLSKSKSSLSLGATSTLYPHCDLYPSSTREMLLAPGAPLPGV